ncbi:unnamed protein product [Zymoseptoria tritici ST99CH_1A5]|uniref:Uncharacterized protein n=1 Tax=Zymoseptoria tritici ST99CH_1A5 TaxID=1276529 RepID=A0A1Y6LHZ6_ZYMTR|nr:unnamed protein product [Zymoseptoria tritici ST99CH_1A5]
MSATIIDIVQHKVLELNLANLGDDYFTRLIVEELEKGIDEAAMLSHMRELLAGAMDEGLTGEFVRFLYHDAQLQAAQHGTQQQQQQPPPSPPMTQTGPAEGNSTDAEQADTDSADKWRVFEEALNSDLEARRGPWDLTESAPATDVVVSYIVDRFKNDDRLSRAKLTAELVANFFAAHVDGEKVKDFVNKGVFTRNRERLVAKGAVKPTLGEEGVVSDEIWKDCSTCQGKRLLNCDLSTRVKRHDNGSITHVDSESGVMAPCSNCRWFGGPNCNCLLSGISTAAALRTQAELYWIRYSRAGLPDPSLAPLPGLSPMANVDSRWRGEAIHTPPRIPARVQYDPRRELPAVTGSKSQARKQAFLDNKAHPSHGAANPEAPSIPPTGLDRTPASLVLQTGSSVTLELTLRNEGSGPMDIGPQLAAASRLGSVRNVRVDGNPNKFQRTNTCARPSKDEAPTFAKQPPSAPLPQASELPVRAPSATPNPMKRPAEDDIDKAAESSSEDEGDMLVEVEEF